MIRDRTVDIGFFGQAIGFAWIERERDHAILKVPSWLPKHVVSRALDEMEADYKIRYGPTAKIIRGKQLVRFEWEPDS